MGMYEVQPSAVKNEREREREEIREDYKQGLLQVHNSSRSTNQGPIQESGLAVAATMPNFKSSTTDMTRESREYLSYTCQWW